VLICIGIRYNFCVMKFIVRATGYCPKEKSTGFIVITYTPYTQKTNSSFLSPIHTFYFGQKDGDNTLDKVVEYLEIAGYERIYVVEDFGVLDSFWEGYVPEDEVLSYIQVTYI
jgi:hypothetical protein